MFRHEIQVMFLEVSENKFMPRFVICQWKAMKLTARYFSNFILAIPITGTAQEKIENTKTLEKTLIFPHPSDTSAPTRVPAPASLQNTYAMLKIAIDNFIVSNANYVIGDEERNKYTSNMATSGTAKYTFEFPDLRGSCSDVENKAIQDYIQTTKRTKTAFVRISGPEFRASPNPTFDYSVDIIHLTEDIPLEKFPC